MIPNYHPGAFIALEGIDGGGKSYMTALLREWLTGFDGLQVTLTKEPDKTSTWGKKIYEDLAKPDGLHKSDPMGFQAWYACDSKRNVQRVVSQISSTVNKAVVLADRCRVSMVYGAGSAADFPALVQLNLAIAGDYFIWPDTVIILDVHPTVALERLKQKGRELDGHENWQKLEKVRRLYLQFAYKYPNCHVVDASGSAESVFRAVQQHVRGVLVRKGLIKAEEVSI